LVVGYGLPSHPWSLACRRASAARRTSSRSRWYASRTRFPDLRAASLRTATCSVASFHADSPRADDYHPDPSSCPLMKRPHRSRRKRPTGGRRSATPDGGHCPLERTRCSCGQRSSPRTTSSRAARDDCSRRGQQPRRTSLTGRSLPTWTKSASRQAPSRRMETSSPLNATSTCATRWSRRSTGSLRPSRALRACGLPTRCV
jgi:hypothetical protein